MLIRDKKNSILEKTLKLSMITTSVFTMLMAAVLVIFGEQIVRLWTGNTIYIPLGLFIAYGLWAVLEAVGNAFAMFLNGCQLLKPQIITVIFFATVGL